MNPPRTIGSISPQVIGQGILYLFNAIRVTPDFSYRSVSWHGVAISESEKPEGDCIFKNARREKIFELEKVGHGSSVILNHIDSNQTNTNSNHVDSNNTDSNQLIPADPTNIGSINDSADVRAIQ